MKKLAVMCCVLLMLATSMPMPSQAGDGRGGLMGFIAGCCFGVRTGGDYNEGKEIHWREWIYIIPVVNIVAAIWTGIEGYQGKTRSDYASGYGSSFY